MLASPFTFFRGAAAVMADDLATTPVSGLDAQLCGDAHLLNFGFFASPERSLVFDVNDFDETLRGPFEWDVKRLAASIDVAARDRDFSAADRRATVLAAVAMYRTAMGQFASMRNLDLWYARLDAETLVAQIRTVTERKQLQRGRKKALANDSMRALGKLTRIVDGEPRIISEPPLVEPIADLVAHGTATSVVESAIETALAKYQQSLLSDRRELLQGYRYVDLARKVVGIGSVGTRCWIVLLLGRDANDPLFLQIKEAEESVLEGPEGAAPWPNHGQRVVEGQRLMQATSDIFLGWLDVDAAIDGTAARDYYVRQLWDWKASIDVGSCVPRAWSSTPGPAAGRSPVPTRGRATASRSRRTWDEAMCSTRRSPTSRPPTPTRTSATMRRCGRRWTMGGSPRTSPPSPARRQVPSRSCRSGGGVCTPSRCSCSRSRSEPPARSAPPAT